MNISLYRGTEESYLKRSLLEPTLTQNEPTQTVHKYLWFPNPDIRSYLYKNQDIHLLKVLIFDWIPILVDIDLRAVFNCKG